MKKLAAGIILGLCLGVGATWFVLHREAEESKPHTDTAPAGTEKPKENPLRLNAVKRGALGITLEKPASSRLTPEVSAYGRVIDPVSLITLAAELELAQVAHAASEKAAARARELFAAGGNASRQNLETALATEARDRATASAARARLAASWGHESTDPKKLARWLAALEHGRALARLDVPPGESVAENPKTAKAAPALGGELSEIEIIGDAPTADPQFQGRSFLVLLGERSPPIGTSLRGVLPAAGESTSMLVVPRSAVVYHQGSAWIYVLGEEDTLERKIVTLIRSIGDKVALTGIEENEQVVTTGAGQLLSAELQTGGAPEEK